jgi:hypothetical protein
VARGLLDGAVTERRVHEDLTCRIGLARGDEPGHTDGEGHQRLAAVDGVRECRQRAVRHGAGERGDHARWSGRGAAATGECPCRTTGGEPQQEGADGEHGEDGQERGGQREEEEEAVLWAGGHGEHHGFVGGLCYSEALCW